MPVEKVIDSVGHSMRLYIHENHPQYMTNPTFNHARIENFPNFPLRDDDVMLCSYPKSGCHWLWEIIRQLQDGQATTIETEKEAFMIEDNKNEIEACMSPRILNNHQWFQEQPKDLLKKKTKVVFVYRNPKDVAVSLFYHVTRLPKSFEYTGDFKAFLVRFAEGLVESGPVFEYLREWERGIKENPDINSCILCYEDLKINPIPELRKLSIFLGKQHNDQFLQSVVTATSIEVMGKIKGKSTQDSQGPIMYRKGVIGDWKNHFTVAQNEWFDHIIRTRMQGSDFFQFKYSFPFV